MQIVGNLLRRLTWREPVELGDRMHPNYVHSFTEAELAAGLQEAGFELEFYASRSYGHAVARASDPRPSPT